MKIKHLLLIPIVGYLIYLMYHTFTVSYDLNENELTVFDTFANVVTVVMLTVLLLLSLFIIIYLNDETIIFKRIKKFLNHKIL